ncbi:MAG: TrmH family RNA methyltransferase [Muribaculaceae bacterium]|nr:TrmH family RNA methyltransferase [Muribaculaceae bacterium]
MIELTRITETEYHRIAKKPLSLMADNVRSMMNIGSMLRTADAFNIREMLMAGISAVPPHPEISKTALGAENSVSWRYVSDAVEEVRRMKAEGVRIAVLEQTHGSIPLVDFNPDRYPRYFDNNIEWLLVVGNEVTGVAQEIVDLADAALEIPMYGVKHSLNVAVSAGIALWHLTNHLSERHPS